MSDFISFNGSSNEDVNITIDAPLKDIVGLLSIIQFACDMNLSDDEVDFFNLYEIVFQQIAGYGTIVSEEDND